MSKIATIMGLSTTFRAASGLLRSILRSIAADLTADVKLAINL
jgi:hypothetical protein